MTVSSTAVVIRRTVNSVSELTSGALILANGQWGIATADRMIVVRDLSGNFLQFPSTDQIGNVIASTMIVRAPVANVAALPADPAGSMRMTLDTGIYHKRWSGAWGSIGTAVTALAPLFISAGSVAHTIDSTTRHVSDAAIANWDGEPALRTAADADHVAADDPHTQYALESTIGVANGLCPLDATSKVLAQYLPSYVDDVLDFANLAAFPAVGESGKIYIAEDTNLQYRWSGSAYAGMNASLALGTTSVTAYRGDYGAAAYTHSLITAANPHGTTFSQLGGTASLAQLATIPTLTILGNSTAGTAAVTALTAAQAKVLLALDQLGNTSDASKPVSTAQQAALNLKANLAGATFSGAISATNLSGTNTGDVPFETDVLNLQPDGAAYLGSTTKTVKSNHIHPTDATRAPLASPTFTGTVGGITAAMVGATPAFSLSLNNVPRVGASNTLVSGSLTDTGTAITASVPLTVGGVSKIKASGDGRYAYFGHSSYVDTLHNGMVQSGSGGDAGFTYLIGTNAVVRGDTLIQFQTSNTAGDLRMTISPTAITASVPLTVGNLTLIARPDSPTTIGSIYGEGVATKTNANYGITITKDGTTSAINAVTQSIMAVGGVAKLTATDTAITASVPINGTISRWNGYAQVFVALGFQGTDGTTIYFCY